MLTLKKGDLNLEKVASNVTIGLDIDGFTASIEQPSNVEAANHPLVKRRYVVVNILSVDYRDVSVVYPTTFNRLTLITCDIPSYVAEQGIYYERLVIIADEVPL